MPFEPLNPPKSEALWDFQMQRDKLVMANQLVMVDKQQKRAIVIDGTIPSDSNIRKKEHKEL